MRRERTDRERLMDDAVLLYLWAGAQEKQQDESVGDRLKLTKLAFLVANDLFWHDIKGLNVPFFRYTYGPYSRELNTNWGDLACGGQMIEEEQFKVTDDGRRLAVAFGAEVLNLHANRNIKNKLDEVIERYGGMSTEKLLEHVYAMNCRTLDGPGKHKVSTISQYINLTAILDEDEATESLTISPGWEMTLELAFHPDALSNLQDGVEAIREGRVFGWEAFDTYV